MRIAMTAPSSMTATRTPTPTMTCDKNGLPHATSAEGSGSRPSVVGCVRCVSARGTGGAASYRVVSCARAPGCCAVTRDAVVVMCMWLCTELN